jgi:hypothetical protein
MPCRTLATSSITLSGNFLSTFLQARSTGDAALDLGGRALRAESDRGSALMSVTVAGRSRSQESTHPGQGSGLAASLAPRFWHEQTFQQADHASSSQGCADRACGSLVQLVRHFPINWLTKIGK